MSESQKLFSQEIEENQASEVAPTSVVDVITEESSLAIRERGGFIVDCELSSVSTGERRKVLYSDADISSPKLTASHIMSPVGPSDGVGGQHGFARWADYHLFTLGDDSQEGKKRVAIQAKRSDDGPAIAKTFELGESDLSMHTTVFNSDSDLLETSLGEHLYFSLSNEDFNGLRVNGKSLDELLGDGAEEDVKAGKPIYWSGFFGSAEIAFPEGYKVKLSAACKGNENTLRMLVWHRPGSPSICFEPTVGFDVFGGNNVMKLNPHGSSTLSTRIELE